MFCLMNIVSKFCKGFSFCITDMDVADLSRVSCSLYTLLDFIIGSKAIIDVRRTATNLRGDLERQCIESTKLDNRHVLPCYSGSKAEGLRFQSSDEDWMYIFKDIKVIPSDFYMKIYDSNTTLLLMENEMTKPGFTLLKVIHQPIPMYPEVDISTEYILNGSFLSCKRWREFHTAKGMISNEEFTHGPCASTTIFGSLEYDLAFCLQCDIWPANAQDCIRRLHHCHWPSHDTILSIQNDGVLFVPIGAKQSFFENIEWRTSFSLAEKKLIHAMNHTQFLCYGLLKIFLKEAIDMNPEVKGLLCSYFLKTALFWEITTTSNQWNPSMLLSCFWNCFCRLLHWINYSYCPNFFIPENNMFEGKIEGTNREKLMQHLRTLYSEGFKCLLRCEYLWPMSLPSIMNWPYLELPAPEEPSNSKLALESLKEWLLCLQFSTESPETLGTDVKCLMLDQMIIFSSNSSHISPMKYWFGHYLTRLSMKNSTNTSAVGTCHRQCYHKFTEGLNLLKSGRYDSASHLLYQAMLCHNSRQFNHSLRLIRKCKEKISSPGSMSVYEATEEQYKEAGGDNIAIETMLMRHMFHYIMIIECDGIQYIRELYLECNSHGTNLSFRGLLIPPLLCALFLQYLCRTKLGHQREANDVLYELSLLVQHGNDKHFRKIDYPTGWQILGICQQMSGDYPAACQSFRRAIQLDDCHLVKKAACVRLGTILANYF